MVSKSMMIILAEIEKVNASLLFIIVIVIIITGDEEIK